MIAFFLIIAATIILISSIRLYESYTNGKLETDDLTPGVRLAAWIFTILNIPFALMAICIIIYPPLFIPTIPGFVLWWNYLQMGRDRLSLEASIDTWKWTIVYNVCLMVIGLIAVGMELTIFVYALPLFAIGLSGVMIRILNEKKKETELTENSEHLASVGV